MSRIECKWGRTKDFAHLHSIRLMWSTASELGLNYLIKDFISSNFKRRLSFLLSNSKVSSLLLKLQTFRVGKYSLPFHCIWLTDKRPKKMCEEIWICLVLAELLHFKLKSRISSAIYAKKLSDIKWVTKGNRKIPHTLFESISVSIPSENFKAMA